MLCVLLFLIIVNADLYTLVVSQTSLKLYPLRKIKQTGLHGLMEGQSFCIMSVGLGSTHKPIFFFFSENNYNFMLTYKQMEERRPTFVPESMAWLLSA